MTRGQKKFAYGLLYAVVIGLVVLALIPKSHTPAPACSGSSCGTIGPLPLQTESVQLFKSESTHRIVTLAEVVNPNADYGANSFSYEFDISDRDGGPLTSVSGSNDIYPDETKYIVGVYNAGNADLSLVSDTPVFKIYPPDFQPAAGFLKPNLALTSGPETDVSSNGIKVTGKVKNQGASSVSEVEIVSILQDKYGDPVFAAQTVIQGLEAFEELPFEVDFPADLATVQKIDSTKTAVFLSE